MSANTIAEGLGAVVAKQRPKAHDWIDYSLEIEEFLTGPSIPSFVDGAVETGMNRDDQYRPVEFSITTAEPYL